MQRLTVEKLKERKTEAETDGDRERHPQRQKGKGRDEMIDLSIALSTWLIFVFHCFSAAVI